MKLQSLGLYQDAADGAPAAGDLVFLDSDADGKIDRVGIVISVDEENDSLNVIEGDYAAEDGADAVCEAVYGLSESCVVGYGVLPEKDSNVEVYTASADGVTVTVTAPIGALPEGSELCVSLIEEGSDAYNAAAEAIGYEEETVEVAVSESEDGIALASEEDAETETVAASGLAVLDISFYVDGKEVEPTEAVTVSIDASAIIPEEADASTIEVQHLAETEDGVVEATVVADATAETDGTVTVSVEDEGTTAVVEFEVESFSIFTLRWDNNTTTDIVATAYLYETETETDTVIGRNGSTLKLLESGGSVSFTNDNFPVDGYTFHHANVTYGTTTYENATSISLTISSRTTGGPNATTVYTYTCTCVDSNGTSRQLYTGNSAQTVTVSLYYTVNETEADVTISATMTDTGYLLTATPVGFTNTENIEYTWTISSTENATIEDNGDGTATLTWIGGWSESTSDEMDAQALANLVTVSVTGTSTYTDEDGETVTETGSGSTNVSPYYVTVYVYVAAYDDDGNLFSDDMLTLLGIDEDTLDYNKYFPAGEIKLDVAFLYGKSYTTQGAALLTSESDWTDLLAALSAMDTSTLINFSTSSVDSNGSNQDYIDYSLNANNSAGDYLEMAGQDINYTWGSQHSAMFRWNMTTSYGFYDQAVRYHLDLRFSTNTITFYYGNNGLTSDTDKIESRVYITGSTIQEMQESLTIPDNYKFAGFYEDADFNTPWDGVGTPITEDITVYIKLVPIDYVVITYQVAIGEGTVTSPDANDAAVLTGYETFDPDDANENKYTVVGSTAEAADGYEFVGWYSDPSCEDQYLLSTNEKYIPTPPNGTWPDGYEVTYYAKFVPATYEFTLKKVDSTSDTTTLSGASFTLSRTDSNDVTTYYSYKDETVDWVDDLANATTITTGDEGTDTLYSLTTGYTYTLTETSAPDGYNLLTDSITFTVSGGTVTNAYYGSDSDEASDVIEVSEDGKTITVTNTPGVELPHTGGPGTGLITLLGLLLCGGAGLLLYRRKLI